MDKRRKIIGIISIIVLVVMLVSATYAFFRDEILNAFFANVNLKTVADNLTFTTSGDIILNVDPDDFLEGGSSATSEAGYIEVNLNGNLNENYYAYMYIKSNGIDYNSANETPELLLTITYQENDGSATPITSGVTANGVALTYTTQKGISGFDITGLGKDEEALIDFNNPNGITSATKKQRYNITVTIINQDFNQNGLVNKRLKAKLVVSHEVEYLSGGINYLNNEYTDCASVKCALDELYRLYE